MGAYNWLRATIQCYQCKHNFPAVLQVRIGWCRYDEYSLGDTISWMGPEDRIRASHRSESRTMIEAGSKDWQYFALSTGDDHQCPKCGAQGTILAIVKNNVFEATFFTPKLLSYSEVLMGERLEEFLKPPPIE
jgi:hypothetical protein